MRQLLIVTPIFPPDIGGPATYVSTLIKKFPNNININIITFSTKSKKEINFIKISTKQNFIFRQSELFIEIYKKLLKSNICYLQGTLTCGLAVYLASKLTNKPYILKYVGDEVWENYQNNHGNLDLETFLLKNKNSLKIKLQKVILKNAQKIIVPSKYLKNILTTYYNLSSTIIPNAIDISNPKIIKQKNTIIYIGRLVKWKNVDKLIQAFYKLSNNWSLKIVGDGPELIYLVNLSKKLKIDSRIKFYGKLIQKVTSLFIAESEYLVLLSDYEGLSHTLLEAMSLKCKIITSNIQANSDLLQNGKFGILVNQNNQTEIIKSFTKPYNCTKLEYAHQYVENNYSWQNHINNLLKLINNE